MTSAPRAKPSILENPWYWVYVFCTAGLVALVLMGPKFAGRQAQLERNMQARDRAAQQTSGAEPTAPLSSTGDTSITLAPLYTLLGIVFVLAWVMLWRKHFRAARKRPTGDDQARPAEPLEAAP